MKMKYLLSALILTFTIHSWSQTFTNEVKLLPEPYLNNANDMFGCSIDIDSNFAIIGSHGYNKSMGCAFILHYNGSSWETIAKLTASDSSEFDCFGYSVSLEGDVAVIGALYTHDERDSVTGGIYIFEKPSGGWKDTTETKKVMASDRSDYDFFGYSADISGNTIVVGASAEDNNYSFSGSAYVFEKSITGWSDITQIAKLTPSNGGLFDDFGCAVAIENNVIVVGAYRSDFSIEDGGLVYIFEKPLGGWENMNETAKLSSVSNIWGGSFGRSVDINNDIIVVGATNHKGSGDYSAGAAYVYEKPVDGWKDTTETAKLTSCDTMPTFSFGANVSIQDNIVVVGAPGINTSKGNIAAAYIFEKPLTGWQDTIESAKLLQSIPDKEAYYGNDVAIFDDNILVCAIGDDENGENSGAVYVFEKSGPVWNDVNETEKLLPLPYLGISPDDFGSAISMDGDYAIIGVPGFTSNLGKAEVYHFNNTTWEKVGILSASDGKPHDYFGYSVSMDSNVIIVGAYNNISEEGSVYVFEKPIGGWTDMTETAQLTASNGKDNDAFGQCVKISGDVIIVGAQSVDSTDVFLNTYYSVGAVYVFEKPVSGWATMTESKILKMNNEFGRFGSSVDISGDVVIIGEEGYNGIGAAYVYTKPNTGWSNLVKKAKLSPSDGKLFAYFGRSVSIYGDVITIGAEGTDNNERFSGAVYLYEKPEGGWQSMNETTKLTPSDEEEYGYFGSAVKISGDLVLVGKSRDSYYGDASGTIYAFQKPITGWVDMHENYKLYGSDIGNFSNFGRAIDISGSKVMIGANSVGDFYISGAVYIYDYSDLPNALTKKPSYNGNVLLYPNPTDGNIYIDYGNVETGKIYVMDVLGKVLMHQTINGKSDNINLSEYPAGVYYVRINSSNTNIVKTIIKR